jgi:pSer/pThr/pTyr-binding forkhead associated (FHA) protein
LAREISDGLSIVVAAAGREVYSAPVQTAVVSVGRGKGADIRLPDRFASKRHAVLRFEEGIATIEDVGSRNGVRVRAVLLEAGRPTKLRPGDPIQIGSSVLVLRWSRGPRMPPPPVPPAGAAAVCGPAALTEMAINLERTEARRH